MSRILVLILFFITHTFTYSSEVDSFNADASHIEDALPILNAEVRRLINLSVKQANQTDTSCDRDALYRSTKFNLGREVISNVEEFAVKSEKVPKLMRPKEESIFSELSITESFVLAIYPMSMGRTLNMDGHLVVTDKIGHFISEGHYYLSHYIKKGKTLKEAMIFARDVYEGYMGINGSGIYSAGDLVANFHGLRFWSTLIGEYEDPLGTIETAAIVCKSGQWIVQNEFDWRDYIDESWNEARNCSLYSDRIPYEKLAGKVSGHD